MTSRERVTKLIGGTLTDSFCISTGGMPNDGMSVYAYAKLLDHLGIRDSVPKVYDLFQYIPILDTRVIDALGGDFVHAERPRFRFNYHCRGWKEGNLDDGTPVLFPAEFSPEPDGKGGEIVRMDGMIYARRPKNGLYFDIVAKPLAGVTDAAELRLIHPATYMSNEDVDWTVKEIEDLYEKTDKAIVLLIGGQHIEQGQRDFGFEDFYCNLLEEPELMHAYFRRITDSYLDAIERILSRTAGKVSVVWFCDDLGTQDTLQMSLRTFRGMIKPYKKEMFDLIHRKFPGTAVLFHSCGAVFDAIPDFLEMGVDMLNPVQISARGMNPEQLKETYGKDIIFWGGGISTQSMKPSDRVEDLVREAEKNLEILAENGNYVFTQVHNFQADTQPEKIAAIFQMAKENRERLEAGK